MRQMVTVIIFRSLKMMRMHAYLSFFFHSVQDPRSWTITLTVKMDLIVSVEIIQTIPEASSKTWLQGDFVSVKASKIKLRNNLEKADYSV